jgi:hypothetical protein
MDPDLDAKCKDYCKQMSFPYKVFQSMVDDTKDFDLRLKFITSYDNNDREMAHFRRYETWKKYIPDYTENMHLIFLSVYQYLNSEFYHHDYRRLYYEYESSEIKFIFPNKHCKPNNTICNYLEILNELSNRGYVYANIVRYLIDICDSQIITYLQQNFNKNTFLIFEYFYWKIYMIHNGAYHCRVVETYNKNGKRGMDYYIYLKSVKHKFTTEQWKNIKKWWCVPKHLYKHRKKIQSELLEAIMHPDVWTMERDNELGFCPSEMIEYSTKQLDYDVEIQKKQLEYVWKAVLYERKIKSSIKLLTEEYLE